MGGTDGESGTDLPRVPGERTRSSGVDETLASPGSSFAGCGRLVPVGSELAGPICLLVRSAKAPPRDHNVSVTRSDK